MELRLSGDEVSILYGLLHDYLPELKFEAARTEAEDIRRVLLARQTLCERLVEELSPSGRQRPTISTDGPQPRSS